MGLSDKHPGEKHRGPLLEHSRIFYFENEGAPRFFVAAAIGWNATWRERVEVANPGQGCDFVRLNQDILTVYWAITPSRATCARTEAISARPSGGRSPSKRAGVAGAARGDARSSPCPR